MKGLIIAIVLFCVLIANGLAYPNASSSDHVKDIPVELRTDEQILHSLKNTQIIVGGEKINLEGNLNNDQYAKIGLLGALLQRFPTPAPASSSAGSVNYVFYSPLGALIQKLRPTTTTTTAATTTSTSTDSTTTTTTPTTTSTTTTTTTTPTTTTTSTTPTTTTTSTTPTTTTSSTTPTTTTPTTTTPTTTTSSTTPTTTTPSTTPTTTTMP